MSVLLNEVRQGIYLDSVALMRLSAEISALSGIDEAVLMIGTPSNLQIMRLLTCSTQPARTRAQMTWSSLSAQIEKPVLIGH